MQSPPISPRRPAARRQRRAPRVSPARSRRRRPTARRCDAAVGLRRQAVTHRSYSCRKWSQPTEHVLMQSGARPTSGVGRGGHSGLHRPRKVPGGSPAAASPMTTSRIAPSAVTTISTSPSGDRTVTSTPVSALSKSAVASDLLIAVDGLLDPGLVDLPLHRTSPRRHATVYSGRRTLPRRRERTYSRVHACGPRPAYTGLWIACGYCGRPGRGGRQPRQRPDHHRLDSDLRLDVRLDRVPAREYGLQPAKRALGGPLVRRGHSIGSGIDVNGRYPRAEPSASTSR